MGAGAKIFWFVLLVAGLAALVNFAVLPFIADMRARNAMEELLKEGEKEAGIPPYRAELPGKAGQEAIAQGKTIIKRIGEPLRHPKQAVREKGIFVVEKVVGNTYGYDYTQGGDTEANARAIKAIDDWYQANKENKAIK